MINGDDCPYREEALDFLAVDFGEVVGEDEAVVGAADVVVELRTIEAPPALMTWSGTTVELSLAALVYHGALKRSGIDRVSQPLDLMEG